MDESKKVLTISGNASEVAACREMLRSIVMQAQAGDGSEQEPYFPNYDPAMQMVRSGLWIVL